jgi:hypothetical protein
LNERRFLSFVTRRGFAAEGEGEGEGEREDAAEGDERAADAAKCESSAAGIDGIDGDRDEDRDGDGEEDEIQNWIVERGRGGSRASAIAASDHPAACKSQIRERRRESLRDRR